MFEDTTIFLVWAAFTYAFSILITGFMDSWHKVKSEIHAKVRKQINDRIHLVSPESHGDIEYWFDKDNDEFLAQGVDWEEIRDTLKARYPGHAFFFKDAEQHVILVSSKTEWEPMQIEGDIPVRDAIKDVV